MMDVEIMERNRVILPLVDTAIRAADPLPKIISMRENILSGEYRKIFIIGAGKASARMMKAFNGIEAIKFAVSKEITPYGIAAGHPYPDENSYEAARRIISILRSAGKDDLVIFLISGGASSLVGDYAIGVNEIRALTERLMKAGANIYDLNKVRKHISFLKGGRVIKYTEARIISLIVSDVMGDDLSTIGSGITAPDETTFQDAIEVMHKYSVHDDRVMDMLMNPEKYGLMETVKPDEFPSERVENMIICRNSDSLRAVEGRAVEMGYRVKNLGTVVKGEAREVSHWLFHQFEKMGERSILVSGGETVVTVKGKGKGGRNQELVLSLIENVGRDDVITSFGTDGIDGPTDAAGAVADYSTRLKAQFLNWREYLENNDSYSFFKKTGTLLITGPTGTNVMDVQIFMRN